MIELKGITQAIFLSQSAKKAGDQHALHLRVGCKKILRHLCNEIFTHDPGQKKRKNVRRGDWATRKKKRKAVIQQSAHLQKAKVERAAPILHLKSNGQAAEQLPVKTGDFVFVKNPGGKHSSLQAQFKGLRVGTKKRSDLKMSLTNGEAMSKHPNCGVRRR